MREWKIWGKGWGRAHNDEGGLKKGCDSIYPTPRSAIMFFFVRNKSRKEGTVG
ncbi:BZ3500_MvSof-1268-A1-R1_Chr7-1g09325 [Microbotryum saponariae]|uniref:BZ3500_MvSof-1268-A1-R1_Chr7-1g09325 protein n=1 Tax=Microbotryum saponariae TaxID=289078 RepID=A0A2X0M2K2_9BASI|nr:BZ3501_MvSof-1269-A2-R1_Chr7-1g09030 [Microbotryum saponariae]SDA03235.1 BZ3500_MvSof-1268-A1-R1_Chr7-1g09325 [Microbotryum saponariae]